MGSRKPSESVHSRHQKTGVKKQVDLSEVEMCECETAEGNRISR